MEEIWKAIPDQIGYSLSNLGNARNDKSGRVLRSYKSQKGKCLLIRIRTKNYSLAKLMSYLFLDNKYKMVMIKDINLPLTVENIAEYKHAQQLRGKPNNKCRSCSTKGYTKKKNGTYEAQTSIKGVKHFLGIYPTAFEAHQAYRQFIKKHA